MSETVILIMLTILCSIYALENRNVEVTKLFKHQNEDINLYCGLTVKHEEFNRNITVTWYFLKVCKLCFTPYSPKSEDWKLLDDSRGLTLSLDDSNVSSGFYMCKMFPYHIDRFSTLQVEILKTFQVEVVDNQPAPPPELFNDTQSRFEVQMNTPVTLQCKCRSTIKPITIKWFKQKANDSETENNHSYHYMEIKYFENFYQPMPAVLLKELEDNIYLSKLTINNVTEDVSNVVCVAINYYGFSHRNFTINARRRPLFQYEVIQESEDEDIDENATQEKSFELFFIPLIFLLIVIIQLSAIMYLLIYRRLMKDTNKNVIISYAPTLPLQFQI